METHLPNAELVIQPASFTDIPSIQHIARQTWPVTYSNILTEDQLNYMLEKFYSSYSLKEQIKSGHYFLLGLQNNLPFAFASFSQVETYVFKLQKLYVLPTVQRSGAGKKLLQTVESMVKDRGGKILRLNVNRNNPARFFYEKNGFMIVHEEDVDIGNGYFMNDYVMEKTFHGPNPQQTPF